MSTETVPRPASCGQQGICVPAAPQEISFKFLDFIFGAGAAGLVEFRYFGPGHRPRVVDKSTYLPIPLNPSDVASQVLARNGRQMITVGVAPRFRLPDKGGAGKDNHVMQVGCVWADLDFKQAAGGAVEVIRRVRDFPLRPSVVINSGYGRHVYFAFRSPLHDTQLLEWDRVIRALRDALGGDATHNISRVMRLPGTFNIKEPQPVLCDISEEESSWTRYDISEVSDAIERAASDKHSSHPSVPTAGEMAGVPVRTMPIDELRKRGVPAAVIESVITGQRTIRSGPSAGRSDDQSARDFWIASTLLERGLIPEEVKAVFRSHPSGCGSKWAQKGHGEKYLELTVSRAAAQLSERTALRERVKDGDVEGADEAEVGLPPSYEMGSDGSIWFCPPPDGDRKPPKPLLVSNSPIFISELQENIDTGQISVVVTFTYLGRKRSTTILRSQMADNRQLVAALAGEGAPVTSNNARAVLSYLSAYEHAFAPTIPRKRVTGRFGRGRSAGPFFLPGLSSDVQFAPSGPGDAALYRAYASRAGTLPGWVDVTRSVAGDALMIPQVAILSAFVPPLQRRLQIPNFILDINGNTSTGKSTSLKLAASVFGRPYDPDSLVLQWTNTRVAIEQVAGMCSELPVFLDDAQHCPDELKKSVIYMIANGRGKGRGAKGGGIRETLSWHTVALSTSEEPLYEASPHEGARGRILPVGGITTSFRPGSASLVQSLERAVAANHGHAGEAYVRHLNGWADGDWQRWQRRYVSIRTELLKNTSSDLVGRVSGYIAAIQLAAEVACPLLGLPFKPDVVAAWLMLHLDEQQSSQNLVLQALRALADHYISNMNAFAGDGRFSPDKMVALHGASKQFCYIGFLRSTIDLIFQKRRWNQTAVLNKMAEAGVLHATEGDRHTKKVSVEGVKHRMVCIKWSAILPEDAHGENV